MKNRCVKCWKEFEANYKANVCKSCSMIEPGFPVLSFGRTLMKGTQWENKMTRAEEQEISSGVAVPTMNGKFVLGRRESGRIKEKPPRGWKQ